MTESAQSRVGAAYLGRGLLAAAAWWVLAEGEPSAWVFGAPVVLVCTVWTLVWLPPRSRRVRLGPLLRFCRLFLWEGLRSGTDVARRAFRRDMGLRPDYMTYLLSVPEGLPRQLFIYAVNLMPGTLSVLLEGDWLKVHVLDSRLPVREDLARIERAATAVRERSIRAEVPGEAG